MDSRSTPATANHRTRRILVLYDHHWLQVKTIADYLTAFRRYSESEVFYATSFGPCPFDLDSFDAVVIHYSVKVCYPGHLSPSYCRALRRAACPKVLFIQDEYEATHKNHEAIRDLGIGLVFTCVPESSIESVYPKAKFPGVRFVTVLTGFVPLDFIEAARPLPMRSRTTLIGYRGRELGYWYGDLAREKLVIGQRMRALCDARGLKTDIEWAEDRRIYGDDWMRFLCSVRSTLGTESGSNVFDFDGTLTLAIQRDLVANPRVSYEEIRERYLKEIDGVIVMNQISPRIFEAIACRAALVLFEGHYSGVVEAGTHYISLKKDFSNFDEVIRLVNDDAYLETLTTRTFDHVIASGKYTYEAFVRQFDEALRPLLPRVSRRSIAEAAPWLPTPPCDALPAFRSSYRRIWRGPLLKQFWTSLPEAVRMPLRPLLDRGRWKERWIMMPNCVRDFLGPVLRRIRGLLKAT
jgi:hypothetical protein